MARAIAAVDISGIVLPAIQGEGPDIRRVNPRTLLVDDAYQREVSKAGLKLITKIVSNFSWAKYKLPTVVETDEGLIVIDGQHTSIACASIPDLHDIPVAVVAVASTAEQALAFLGINKDRLSVGHVQLHHASAASGDESARSVNEVCEACNVTVLRSPRAPTMYNEGETVAVKNVDDLLRRHGRDHAMKVLTLCRKAKLSPISQAYIKAVSAILLDEEKMAVINEETLLTVVQKTRGSIDKDVKTWAAEHEVPFFKALASVLFKATRNYVSVEGGRSKHAIAAE